ncbi:MAG: hypothetical protein NVSMB22_00610 [Chloroflexota bacterium]
MRATSTICGAAGVVLAALHVPQAPVSAQAASTTRIHAVRGSVNGDDVVRVARRFLGVPYRLGGDGPKAFDCSGFVRYIFSEYGIRLPRTAHEQAASGYAPYPGDLRSGDLLFFYGGQGAQHIAVYVGGDTIIHASSTGRRVRFDLLSRRNHRMAWFHQRLIAVRRIAPIDGYFYLPMGPSSPRVTRDPPSNGSLAHASPVLVAPAARQNY